MRSFHCIDTDLSVGALAETECRLYDRLFSEAEPDKAQAEESEVGTAGPAVRPDFKAHINPHSLEVVTGKFEPSLKDAKSEARYQFERLGYFALDVDSKPGKLVFNRTITLKDTWAKEVRKENK